jgi:hypothetical protein
MTDRAAESLERLERLARRVGYLEQSMRMIVELPPGSQGAYGKFAKAVEIASRALALGEDVGGAKEEK